MLHHWNWGEEPGLGIVTNPDYISQKLVEESICRKLLDESTEMAWDYVIHHSDTV